MAQSADPIEGLLELRGRRIALFRSVPEGPLQDLHQLRPKIGSAPPQVGEALGGLLGEDLFDGGPGEGGLTEEAVKGHRRQAVQIGPLVHPFAQELLRRGELRRTALAGGAAELPLAAERQRQAEVGDPELSGLLEEKVLRLDIAVHQPHRVGDAEGGKRFAHQPHQVLGWHRPVAFDLLRQVGAVDELHRVPEQAGPSGDVVDVDDVGMVDAGGQLGLAPEALHHRRIRGEVGVQHLERDLTLQMEVAYAVHPPESAGPDQPQELVVVPERAAEPLFPEGAVLDADPPCRGDHHRRVVEGPRVRGEVLQHLRCGEVAVERGGPEGAEEDPLDGRRGVGSERARWLELGRIDRGLGAGHRVVEDRADSIDVAGLIAEAPVADLGSHEIEGGGRRVGGKVGENPAAIPQVGHHTAPGQGQQDRRGDDATDDDPVGVRVLAGRQQVTRESVDRRDGAGASLHCVLKALSLDPVPDAIGDLAGEPHVVGVPDGGMVQLGDRLRFAEEPAAHSLVGVEVDPEGDWPIERGVVGGEEHPLTVGRDQGVEPIPGAEGGADALVDAEGRWGGHGGESKGREA